MLHQANACPENNSDTLMRIFITGQGKAAMPGPFVTTTLNVHNVSRCVKTAHLYTMTRWQVQFIPKCQMATSIEAHGILIELHVVPLAASQ